MLLRGRNPAGLVSALRCPSVIDEQKELDRRKRIESKERNGREGSGGERWRKKPLIIVENDDDQIEGRRKEKIEKIESVKQQKGSKKVVRK